MALPLWVAVVLMASAIKGAFRIRTGRVGEGGVVLIGVATEFAQAYERMNAAETDGLVNTFLHQRPRDNAE